MSTNQPTPPVGFHGIDRVIEQVNNPRTAAASNDAEANVLALDELRRKLCQPPPVPQKSKWRFW
jgi:hypothetical protein